MHGSRLLLVALAFAATPALTPAMAQQSIPVGVVAATPQPVTRAIDFVGRVEALERVAVRARVTGYLTEALFADGATIKAGAPLFRIDKAPYEAAVQQAQGALLQAQATLANATLQRARAEELARTQAGSVATRDTALATERSAQGSVIRADADLVTATINLGYTEITAPIDGRIGRAAVTKGNVVSPDGGVLASIVSQDPMGIVFPVSQREFLALQKGPKTDAGSLVVKLRFADGSAYAGDGRIDFVDVSVDRATDTVLVRARVPNPAGVLVDGQFVRVAVQGEKPETKIVIPQAALLADQGGTYVFVAADGKAAVKRVRTGAEIGPDIVAEQGIAAGDLVVVTGLQALRPGAPVTASPLPAALRATGG